LKTIIKEQAGLIWLVTYVNQTSEFEWCVVNWNLRTVDARMRCDQKRDSISCSVFVNYFRFKYQHI
jgi:hypothetical protein